jgi:acetyltransferase-like isoleucine patch superfamily enzyme
MRKQHSILAKLRFKVLSFQGMLRVNFYRLQGMTIGKRTVLGDIHVEWPGSVNIGSDCDIQSNTTFWVQSPFKENNRIIIGDNVFIGRNTEFNCCETIRIGNNCLIASSTVFVDSTHTFTTDQLIARQPTIKKEVVVEEDVWIGTGTKILLGVRLGKGCIIGAGAVVNKSVPTNEIWAGVPAKKIGERKRA